MNSIVIKFLNELESYVAQRNIDITWGPALQTMLEDEGYDPDGRSSKTNPTKSKTG